MGIALALPTPQQQLPGDGAAARSAKSVRPVKDRAWGRVSCFPSPGPVHLPRDGTTCRLSTGRFEPITGWRLRRSGPRHANSPSDSLQSHFRTDYSLPSFSLIFIFRSRILFARARSQMSGTLIVQSCKASATQTVRLCGVTVSGKSLGYQDVFLTQSHSFYIGSGSVWRQAAKAMNPTKCKVFCVCLAVR